MFATMFSSSMGCSAARPARPRRRPGPPARAGADGDRLGAARLGLTDRAAASRASPASPAAAARRALCAPPGPLAPPRPAPPSVYLAQSIGERTVPAPGCYWSDSSSCPAHGAGNSLRAGRGRAPLRRFFLVGLRAGLSP